MSENPAQDQSQLDQIYQKAPLGILLIDSGYRIVQTNPAVLDSLGYDRGILQARCLLDLCHTADRLKLEQLFDQVNQADGRYRRAEVRLLRGDQAYQWTEVTLGVNLPGEELPGEYLLIFQDIQERKEMELELSELHRRLNDQVEAQRVQLAQDLHDGAMQDLHSIQYQLSALQISLPNGEQDQIANIMDTVQEIRQELRSISYNLRPPALSRFGLAKSIRSHAEEFVQKHQEYELQLDLVDDGTLLSEDVRLVLFRIYQQALGNILQHSDASRIEIGLLFQGRKVELRIRDDGKGFELPERWISLVRSGHYGLAGSHDRVRSLGGEFIVQTAPGQGTTLKVIIPDIVEEDR